MRRSGNNSRPALSVCVAVCVALSALVLPLAVQAAAASGRPKVATGSAHARGATVELEGVIDPRGLPTTYWFQYGPTYTYGSQSATGNLLAGTAKVGVNETVTGMQPGYRYRLVAENSAGPPVYGQEHTYTAKARGKGNSGKLKITLNAPAAPVSLGGSVLLSGNISGAGSSTNEVALQDSAYPYREALKNVGAPQPTEPGGRFSFRVSHLTASTHFRVVTTAAKPLDSRTVTVEVAVRVTLNMRSSAKAPGVVRLYGLVTPAEVGSEVFIELEKPASPKTSLKPPKSEKAEERAEQAEEAGRFLSEFTTLTKHATKSYSRFSRVVTIHTAGRYRVLVAVRKGPLVSGYSRVIYIHAVPGSAKKAKKAKKGKSKG